MEYGEGGVFDCEICFGECDPLVSYGSLREFGVDLNRIELLRVF